MAYTPEQIEEKFTLLISKIESGSSLRKALLEESISSATFYQWIENDELRQKQYARACEERADKIFEDILEIADDSSQDELITENGVMQNSEFIARSRLRVDSRKWMVGKLNPKKYGDRTILSGDSENPITISFED